MKNILHIIGNSEYGGIVPYVYALCLESQKRGDNPRVLATNSRIIDYFESRKIEVVKFKGIYRKISLNDIIDIIRLVYYLKFSKFDVVHTHTSKGGFIGRIAAYLAGVNFIVHTSQGFAFNDFTSNIFLKFTLLWLEKLAALFSDLLIVVNKNDLDLVLSLNIINVAKVKLIHNGIIIDNILFEYNPEIVDHVNLLFIGRLTKQKGILDLINALKIINSNKFKLSVIGDGDQYSECVDYVNKIGLNNQVTFHGFQNDLYKFIKDCHIFLMPSHWEGMPMTLLYVMSYGIPVIANNIKGINDVCEDHITALLCSKPYVDDLARNICYLSSNYELRLNLSINSKRVIKDKFSSDICAFNTVNLYK